MKRKTVRPERHKIINEKRNHQKTVRLCGLILCAAFFIVLLSVRLPETAKIQKSQSKHTKVQHTKGPSSKEKTSHKSRNPKIRVLLMTTGYKGTTHQEVKLYAQNGMILQYANKKTKISAGKTITIRPSDKRLQNGKLTVVAKRGKLQVRSLQRGYGVPSYSGTLELRRAGNRLVLINELPVEDYLCAVVPSEMPSSYQLEALKAQAVCARSYACRQMESYAYPKYKAHVNDSTDYQVYGNSKMSDSATTAVRQTTGEVVRYKGKIATTYYYSTSSGRTTTVEAWGSQRSGKNAYLKSVRVKGAKGDYEKNLPWYRWNASIPIKELSSILYKNTGKDVGNIKSIRITKRGPGKVALELQVRGDKGTLLVKTENKIRSALAGDYLIEKQDGSKVKFQTLLPSAFISIKKGKKQIQIRGGGFGHGIGMSQTAANEMAKQKKNYRQILQLFYSNVTID